MTRRSRATLRNFFAPGARPTRDQFSDLIDSALIMEDEGFSKTPADGLKVVTIKDENGLISFQQHLSPTVNWSLAFLDGAGKQLGLKPSAVKDRSGPNGEDAPPLIAFQAPDPGPAGRPGLAAPGQVRINADVGIKVASPRFDLDVGGVVCADGRMGREAPPVKADGQFHPITPTLSGCVAFEVMAGVSGVKSGGRFALLHAIAMNANNPIWWDDVLGLRRRIRSQHAYYSRRSDRLQLSWSKKQDRVAERHDPNDVHGMDAKFTLNIRTRSTYLDDNPDIKIQAFVTRLWGDPASWPKVPVIPDPLL